MSEATGAPVYIVHLAAKRALDVATEARSRGVPIFVETRPVYLHYTADVYQQEDAALYLGVPPIRPQRDQDALWEGIAIGTVHVVGTDHVPYTKEHKLDPSQKVGQGNFLGGMPNLQEYMPMLYSEGVVKSASPSSASSRSRRRTPPSSSDSTRGKVYSPSAPMPTSRSGIPTRRERSETKTCCQAPAFRSMPAGR